MRRKHFNALGYCFNSCERYINDPRDLVTPHIPLLAEGVTSTRGVLTNQGNVGQCNRVGSSNRNAFYILQAIQELPTLSQFAKLHLRSVNVDGNFGPLVEFSGNSFQCALNIYTNYATDKAYIQDTVVGQFGQWLFLEANQLECDLYEFACWPHNPRIDFEELVAGYVYNDTTWLEGLATRYGIAFVEARREILVQQLQRLGMKPQ